MIPFLLVLLLLSAIAAFEAVAVTHGVDSREGFARRTSR